VDFAVGLHHVGALRRLEGLQHRLDPILGTAAEGPERLGAEHPHPVLVEQPEQQLGGCEIRIGQFVLAHRLALAGDAAHGIHPLAGQGVNLGFGDAQALAAVLAERGALADPGAPILLERYARRRAAPVAAMQAVTDGLVRLFGSALPGVAALRNLGLAAVSKLPPLRQALAQPALR